MKTQTFILLVLSFVQTISWLPGTVKVEGASQYDMTDYGFSTGAGLEIKTRNLNAWQIGFILFFSKSKIQRPFPIFKRSS